MTRRRAWPLPQAAAVRPAYRLPCPVTIHCRLSTLTLPPKATFLKRSLRSDGMWELLLRVSRALDLVHRVFLSRPRALSLTSCIDWLTVHRAVKSLHGRHPALPSSTLSLLVCASPWTSILFWNYRAVRASSTCSEAAARAPYDSNYSSPRPLELLAWPACHVHFAACSLVDYSQLRRRMHSSCPSMPFESRRELHGRRRPRMKSHGLSMAPKKSKPPFVRFINSYEGDATTLERDDLSLAYHLVQPACTSRWSTGGSPARSSNGEPPKKRQKTANKDSCDQDKCAHRPKCCNHLGQVKWDDKGGLHRYVEAHGSVSTVQKRR